LIYGCLWPGCYHGLIVNSEEKLENETVFVRQ
jgi:hypothetical protein